MTTDQERTTQGLPDLLTVNEVARILRVDPTTCRRWIKDGALEAVTLPHNGKRIAYRIKGEVMDKMLSEGNEEGR